MHIENWGGLIPLASNLYHKLVDKKDVDLLKVNIYFFKRPTIEKMVPGRHMLSKMIVYRMEP